MLLKETFLLACTSSLTSYPEQKHSQKTTSLTQTQLHFTTKLCIATASFLGTLSTVHDAHSLYTQLGCEEKAAPVSHFTLMS